MQGAQVRPGLLAEDAVLLGPWPQQAHSKGRAGAEESQGRGDWSLGERSAAREGVASGSWVLGEAQGLQG